MVYQQKIRVLIVEDDIATCRLCSFLLKNEGDFQVVGTAQDGREAISKVDVLKPDIVVMDVNMPHLNGIDASKIISSKFPMVGIIIVSAFLTDLRRCIEAGAIDFLAKPFEFSDLIDRIHRAYRIIELRKQNTSQISLPSSLEVEEIVARIFKIREELEHYTRRPFSANLINRIDNLVASIVHDLRSPISIILNIIDGVLIRSNIAFEQVNRIRRRVMYCRLILDSFLNLTVVERITLREIRLYDVIEETVSILQDRFSSSCRIHIDIPSDLCIQSDYNLLRLVFMNVISNALEVSPEKGEIKIFGKFTGHYVLIDVKDEGIGVSASDEQKLFDVGFTTKPAHCGIGLYVARRIMRQLQGNIVYARNRKAGSTFSIIIPNNFVSFHGSLSQLQTELANLETSLEEFRRRQISEDMEKHISEEFRRSIFTFAMNLYRELYAIQTMIQDLLNIGGDDNFRQALDKMLMNCSYSQLIVRNMAELGGEVPPRPALVSVAQVILDVLDLLERKMPSEYYKVEVEIDPTLEDVEADETALKQVFVNLLRNALDAMPEGGVLTIRAVQEDGVVVIDVSDTGVGIPTENLGSLFSPGFTTKPKGYGLGLYSARSIVERFGGTIRVSSQVGSGTTFTVRLPTAAKNK